MTGPDEPRRMPHFSLRTLIIGVNVIGVFVAGRISMKMCAIALSTGLLLGVAGLVIELATGSRRRASARVLAPMMALAGIVYWLAIGFVFPEL